MKYDPIIYASLPRRIKASIVDGIILLSLFTLIPIVFSSVSNSETPVKAILMYAPLFLFEPFLITYLGYTIGHYFFGIRIVRIDNHLKCPLYISFVRYYAKALLGVFSATYMLFSKNQQAIHDHLAKTIVLLSKKKLENNPELANSHSESTLDFSYLQSSPLKRFVIFILWYIFCAIILGIAIEVIALFVIPGYTIETEKMPEYMEITAQLIFAILFFLLALAAAQGYLPGARRKKRDPEST